MRRLSSALLATVALIAAASPALAYDYTELTIANRRDYVFDANGILYITAGDSIQRYDTTAGAFLSPFVVGGNLIGIDLSPDGQWLAVADATTQGPNNRILLVDTGTGDVTEVSFELAFGEAGTYMVAWGADYQVLVTSLFAGSGWVPLRRYDPVSDQTTVLGSVRQDTMLTASADRLTIGLAEGNISNGPVHAYDVASGAISADVATGWFTFEVAVAPQRDQFVVPTYNGAYVYSYDGSSFQFETTLGQYASHGPVSAVFAPAGDVLYTAEYGGPQGGVKIYDTTTWAQVGMLDNYQFPWSGNGALGEGRIKVSPDGLWLVVSVQGGARLYSLSQ
jgi:hypothetical protein